MAIQKYKAILPRKGWKDVHIVATDGPGMYKIEHSVFAEDFGAILSRPSTFRIKIPLHYEDGSGEWPERFLGCHITILVRTVITGAQRLSQESLNINGFLLPGEAMLSLRYSPEDPYPECTALDMKLNVAFKYLPHKRSGLAYIPVCTYDELLKQGRSKGFFL